ncbi:phage tail family protein [Bacillus cereus group sp. BfR-BA-01451]|uniref:phage tail family protein n=1 Tax=Bacillus cereus group sp. BfR-BA-01451 TaxID=2920354 RepID=UPI001F57F81D|nr:phage tail family protein [Bacillus cereus group sp. BfR-BA-01451]
MSWLCLIIQKLDGKVYNLLDYDIRVLDYTLSSSNFVTTYEEVEGYDGAIPIRTNGKQRMSQANCFFMARDSYDYVLLRNEIFKIFASKEYFYLIDVREPGIRSYVRAQSFDPQQVISKAGMFQVTFESPRTYRESVGKTTDPFTFDSNLWQIGQGLIAEDTKYTHNTTSFRIYNAGSVTIDPRSFPLKITYKGISNNLSIKNVTTGNLWSYTGSTASENDVITLDGVKSYRTGIGSIFKDTNWGLITLKDGWNDFILTGTAGSFEIKFDFRFYYL